MVTKLGHLVLGTKGCAELNPVCRVESCVLSTLNPFTVGAEHFAHEQRGRGLWPCKKHRVECA